VVSQESASGASGLGPASDSPTEPPLAPPWEFRGRDLGRILNLSDGIFAFSMTLLVLSLALPVGTQGSGVRSYLTSSTFVGSLFSYVISFFVIFAWWRAHHLVFHYIRSHDRRLIQLNVVFLLFIAVLPFATEALNASGSDPVGVVFFALIEVATGLALTGLWTYALTVGKLTAPDLPKAWGRYILLTVVSVSIVFGLSIPVAFVKISYAEYLWIAIFVLPWLVRKRT
jgi:uncharacterized membrane protein